MTLTLASSSLLLLLASYANAQFGGGNPYGGSGGNPFSSSGGGGGSGSPFGSQGFGGFAGASTTVIAAHAICGTVAFGLLFPVGGIMIRLLSFRGLWLAHGIFQIAAYIIFAAAVVLGIWMVKHIPTNLNIWQNAHPIIGLALFAVLFLQPFLGLLHHFAFKKHNKRVVWSYAHIWIGRIAITIGIINGGLGLQLSQKLGVYAPHRSTIIAYSAAAGVVWLLYVLSILIGEAKRRRARYEAVRAAPPPSYKSRARRYSSEEEVRYA